MSGIDIYKHKLLGFIECPSTNSFVDSNEGTRRIGVYQLLENIPPDEKYFDGRIGDILLGAGNGEAPAFRISNPIAFQFFTLNEAEFYDLEFDNLTDIFKAFWSPTKSYILCEGFLKLGWTVETDIEMWLAENVCKLLISTVDDYSIYRTEQLDLSTNLSFFDVTN
ncbi:hypothetical protein [Pedobacter roseus]|uniref:Uncharacterized protein n=1 Tax=Pedobacter roseus TaxID=336820 RepID=A0A7G9QAU3_9SPHI|nr:hypothetical protein [Pedobacter roseus]QNN40468.1 hypothetical protein H9L23_15085 [Pedobacter roseus]